MSKSFYNSLNILDNSLGKVNRIHLLAAVFGIGVATFLAVEPTQFWLLLVLAGLIAIGTDGLVRSHPKASFRHLTDTTLFLFIPVLLTISTGFFLEATVSGYWAVPVGLLASIPFGMTLKAEYNSVDAKAPEYHYNRLVITTASYLTALFFYATIYDFQLGLWSSTIMVGLISILTSIELLREGRVTTLRALICATTIGALMSQVAWGLNFLPLTSLIAGTFLLVAFYLLTGLTDHYLGQRLNPYTASGFAAIAAMGLLIVISTHIFT